MMLYTLPIGHQVAVVLRVFGIVAVPDPIKQSAAGGQGSVFARNDVAVGGWLSERREV